MPKQEEGRPNVQQDIPNRPRNLTEVSRAVLRSEQAKRWTKKYRTEVAASSSSLLSTFAASKITDLVIADSFQYPLDSVKTRLQAYKFNSFADCVRHTYKTEGFHGFYRGVWSPLASITLVRTVSFSIYQRSKYALDNWIYQTTGTSPLVVANTRDAWPTFSTIACFGLAGVNAGAAITVIACPFELTKLSAQISVLMAERNDGGGKNEAVRKSYQNLGTWKTAQNLVKHRGWTGLYSGFHLHLRLGVSMSRSCIVNAIFFTAFEFTKKRINGMSYDEELLRANNL
ncbi:unnamed protein product [Alternaria alternata]